MSDANLMDANCIHGVTWWECEQCEQPEPCDRPHLTDADRAVLDAAEELIEADKFGGPGEFGYALMALTRAVDALVAARREAQ